MDLPFELPRASMKLAARIVFGCMLAVGAAGVASAQLPVAELKSIFPPGGKQGATVDVQITGTDLDGTGALLFSLPGITAEPKMEEAGPLVKTPRPVENQFTIKIPADAPPGIYEVRAVGRYGASNPRAFVVGSLEEQRDNGANRSSDTAQEIPVGSVVNGTTEGDSLDYYKLNLKQGQRVIIDCWARRIDSRMDSTLVLLSEQGQELARDRDTEGRDALLDFTAPADGAYLVGVHDFLYRGGAEYFYRLRAHAGPHVDFVFPPVAEAGKPAKVTVYGRNLPGSKVDDNVQLDDRPLEALEVEITPPADEKAQRQLAVTGFVKPHTASIDTFAWQFTSPAGAADPAAIAFAQAPITVEQEPNDEPAQAGKVTPPCEYVGRFYPEADRDWVEFAAKQGDAFWIEVVAHRYGLDADPFLLVQKVTKNDKGEEQISDVAQVDDPGDRNTRIGTDFDTSTDDPSWKLEAGEDATYRLQVRDNFGSSRSDPRYAYRLIIRRARPDFRLIATPAPGPTANANQVLQHASVLRRGGTTLVEIRTERLDGFAGEIEVTAEGLPQGVTCAGAILGGAVNEGCLVLTAEENAPAWSGPITIVGKAKIEDRDVTRSARAGALVWGTNNRQQETPIARMARDLVLSVVENETSAALVKVGDGAVIETSKGGKVEIPVSAVWRGEIKGDIALAPIGLPREFPVGNIALKKDQDGKLEFTLNNNNLQPGSYTFHLRGTTKLAYDRNQDAVKDHEERQKEIDAIIQELTEKSKQATEAKTKATQVAQEAAAAVKQKEQTVAAAKAEEAEKANQELAQAREQLKTAEEAKTMAETEEKAAQDLVKQAQERKKQIDQQLNQVKQANQKKDINLFLVSTPIRVRVAPDPIEPSAAAPAAVKQGEKTQIAVSVNRLYGFADPVEVTLEAPGVNGVSAPKLTIPKDQSEGKLEVTAAGNAGVGEHTVNLRFRVRFNNVQSDEVVPLPLKVEMAEKK